MTYTADDLRTYVRKTLERASRSPCSIQHAMDFSDVPSDIQPLILCACLTGYAELYDWSGVPTAAPV